MVAEAGFTRIPAFEDRYRVIAPDYQYVSTAALLLDGLGGVLDAEGVRVAHVEEYLFVINEFLHQE
jgi:hypothetical protein